MKFKVNAPVTRKLTPAEGHCKQRPSAVPESGNQRLIQLFNPFARDARGMFIDTPTEIKTPFVTQYTSTTNFRDKYMCRIDTFNFSTSLSFCSKWDRIVASTLSLFTISSSNWVDFFLSSSRAFYKMNKFKKRQKELCYHMYAAK